MDNHIRDPNIHLAGLHDIYAGKIDQPILQNLLCFVHSRVVSHLYHSVVDLSLVYLMHHFVGGFAAGAAVFGLV